MRNPDAFARDGAMLIGLNDSGICQLPLEAGEPLKLLSVPGSAPEDLCLVCTESVEGYIAYRYIDLDVDQEYRQ